MASKPRNSCSGQPWIERRLRRLGVALLLAPTLALAVPGLTDYRPLTERWVTAQLSASLGPAPDLDRIASVLYGLVTPPRAAPIPVLLERTAGLVRQLDPAGLDCGQRVNLRFIVALLRLGGVERERLPETSADGCSRGATPLDLASELYLRCHLGAPPRPRALELARLQGLQRTLSTRNPGDQNRPGPTPGADRP